tara:strand:+ start:99 stop:257 length:159 start_codon:yes stop_codon:yes gene_type:complete
LVERFNRKKGVVMKKETIEKLTTILEYTQEIVAGLILVMIFCFIGFMILINI